MAVGLGKLGVFYVQLISMPEDYINNDFEQVKALSYLRPTFWISTPLRALICLSSPPCGLLESLIEAASVSFGRFSRIYRIPSGFFYHKRSKALTLDKREGKWSSGFTVKRKLPFLLSNRRRMGFEDAI